MTTLQRPNERFRHPGGSGGIAIFYEDIFGGGGAPVGLQHLAREASGDLPVYLYGKTSTETPELGDAVARDYSSVARLPALLKSWLAIDQPSMMLVIGFFLPHNPIAVGVAERAGVPVALHPMSQISTTMFEDRVFTHGCDVPELEQQELNAERTTDRIAGRVSPMAKKVFCATAGRYMTSKSTALAALSLSLIHI